MKKGNRGSKNDLTRQAEQAGMRAQYIGQVAISEETIKGSALYKNLRAQGYPHELASIHGLQDVQTGLAIQAMGANLLWAQEMRHAQGQISNFKLMLEMRGETDEAIAAAVVSAQASHRLPLVPAVPPAAPPPGIAFPVGVGVPPLAARLVTQVTSVTAGLVVVAATALPDATANDGAAFDSIIGISTGITGTSANIAYNGLLLGGFTGLNAGQLYYVGLDGTPVILGDPTSALQQQGSLVAQLRLAGDAGQKYWTRQVGLALNTTVMQVMLGQAISIIP